MLGAETSSLLLGLGPEHVLRVGTRPPGSAEVSQPDLSENPLKT